MLTATLRPDSSASPMPSLRTFEELDLNRLSAAQRQAEAAELALVGARALRRRPAPLHREAAWGCRALGGHVSLVDRLECRL